MNKNNKRKKRKKTVNAINRNNNKPRNKRKRISKVGKVLKLIFSSIYATLVALRVLGKRRNKFSIIATSLLIVFVIYFFTNKNAYKVLVDGVHISTIGNNSITEQDFINNTNARLASEAGTKVLINENITFRPVNSLKRNRNTVEQALRDVSNVLTYKVEAGVFIVNEQEIVIVSSVAEANQIRDEIINQYIPQEVTILGKGFLEEVKIIERFVEYDEVSSRDMAIRLLNATTQEIQIYEIKPGDVLGGIASFADMTLDELLGLNEGLTLNTPIQPGDNLVISMSVPLLTVYTEEELIITESVPYTVERVYDESQHISFSRTIHQGIEGELQETYIIRKVNGREERRELIESKIITLPTNQVIQVGTREV